MSALADTLAFQIKALGLPEPEREHRFHATRRWKFDFAWPMLGIAVECEGGTWGKKKSRHTTGSGFEGDCIKYNTATIFGWKVLRYTSTMIKSGRAVNEIERVIKKANK